MKNILIFIFSIFLLCSCYNNEYIGNDFCNDFDEECYYMIYTNDTLKNHNECLYKFNKVIQIIQKYQLNFFINSVLTRSYLYY